MTLTLRDSEAAAARVRQSAAQLRFTYRNRILISLSVSQGGLHDFNLPSAGLEGDMDCCWWI